MTDAVSYTTDNYNETMLLGERLIKDIPLGAVIALSGELGAGKTIFAKGIAKGLGVTDEVTSPTFTLVRLYEGKRDGKQAVLYHFDCYRLGGESEAEDSGLGELIGRSDGICVIEWSERIARLLPNNTVKVNITKTGNTQRRIYITL